jgi:hypothetical protein
MCISLSIFVTVRAIEIHIDLDGANLPLRLPGGVVGGRPQGFFQSGVAGLSSELLHKSLPPVGR